MLVWFCSFVWPQLDFFIYFLLALFSISSSFSEIQRCVSFFPLVDFKSSLCFFCFVLFIYSENRFKLEKSFFVRTLSMHFPSKLPSPHFFWSCYYLNVCITGFMLSPTAFLLLFFLATLHRLWNLSFPTRNWTQALHSESIESFFFFFKTLSLNHWLLSWHFESFPWLYF